MKNTTRLFFELLQVAVGNRSRLTTMPTDDEWAELLNICKKQTVEGVCLHAINSLPKEQYPPGSLVGVWAIESFRMKEINKHHALYCGELTRKFKKAGFDTCVIKGQSNVEFYPAHQKGMRAPGDIDIWVVPSDDKRRKGGKKPVVEFVRKVIGKRVDVNFHHIDFPVNRKIPVEVHFTPSFALNPVYGKRMMRVFEEQWSKRRLTESGFYSPTMGFNQIFLLVHIYRHLLMEGVGFRQLVDYYYALKALTDNPELYDVQDKDSMEWHLTTKENVMDCLAYLGMKRFTSAVMWILKHVLAMDDKYLLCEPSEKYGREMLDEIMRGGNFGYFFEDSSKQSTKPKSKIYEQFDAMMHGLRLLRSYPADSIFIPWIYIKIVAVRNYWRIR